MDIGIDFRKFFNTIGVWISSFYGFIFFVSTIVVLCTDIKMEDYQFGGFDIVFLVFVIGLALHKSTK